MKSDFAARFLGTFLILTAQLVYSAQSTSVIEGVVRDAATNEPLPGVTITLSTTGVVPLSYNPSQGRVPDVAATTNAEGSFTLETSVAGRVRIVPSLNGYIYSLPGQARAPADPGVWVQITPGARIQGLELAMARPAVIRGRVLTAEGLPIVGTAGSVTLMRYTYGNDGNRALGYVPGITYGGAGSSQRMNDQGEFRFYDLPPGEYYLGVSGGGGAIGSARGYFYPGVTEEARAVPIRVRGGEDLDLGTLTLPQRQLGVEVRLRLAGAAPSGGRRVYIDNAMLVMSRLADLGRIVLPQVAPGHYDIVVTTDSFGQSEPLLYAAVSLDVGPSGLDQEITLSRGFAIAGNVLIEDDSGTRASAPSSVRCRIRSRYGLGNCAGSQVVPGLHQLEVDGIPPDMYVLSAKVGERDVLAEGLDITGDTLFEVVLAGGGGVVQGTVLSVSGDPQTAAVVALVPDAPYRGAGLLYRSVITDPNGKFEIHGIAPGSYRLFSWSELEGAAYRNAEFLKEFEDRGQPIMVSKRSRQGIDLTVLSRKQ